MSGGPEFYNKKADHAIISMPVKSLLFNDQHRCYEFYADMPCYGPCYMLINLGVPRYEIDKKPTEFPFELYMQRELYK